MSSPIQIRRPDVADDIRALAELTGLSITDAIGAAVRSQLAAEREKTASRIAQRKKEADALLAEISRLPVTGPLLTDEDLYDDQGLPK